MKNSEEQEEAIDRLEKLVELRRSKNTIKYDNCICSTLDLNIVLNLLQEQQEENKKKDKIIDIMARAIDNYDSQLVINIFKDTEDIKQYFERKAE